MGGGALPGAPPGDLHHPGQGEWSDRLTPLMGAQLGSSEATVQGSFFCSENWQLSVPDLVLLVNVAQAREQSWRVSAT